VYIPIVLKYRLHFTFCAASALSSAVFPPFASNLGGIIRILGSGCLLNAFNKGLIFIINRVETTEKFSNSSLVTTSLD
jgi:hypothetical protein